MVVKDGYLRSSDKDRVSHEPGRLSNPSPEDLIAIREQLQQSYLLASLGKMTAGVAHEVSNPLSSILLYSELVMASDVSSQTKKDLKVIHDEAKRAVRILKDILNYGRAAKFQIRRLNVHMIIKKVLDMRRYEQRVQNITVATNLLRTPLYVNGDSSQVMQIFMNLTLNAEEALTKCGGGNITVTTRKEEGWAEISIADNGTGIPPENLNQVFSPFFSTNQEAGGNGLGLCTCYDIVTRHNGLIQAQNNDIGGATFIVRLPVAKIPRTQRTSVA